MTQTSIVDDDIPMCRDEFTLEEGHQFIGEFMKTLRQLNSLNDLVRLHKTAKQLGRTFFNCGKIRSELANYMSDCGLPIVATGFIRRLNNMGVFSNDGTWFSSFYFYSICWNYSDICPAFATQLAVSGLSHLLNLNIGHPPYLENINSKNVYFLIKASLCILLNICRIPGNRDLARYMEGRDALINILGFEGEESLRCIASTCLAYILLEPELPMVLQKSGFTLLQILLSHIRSASLSNRRKYHGFTVAEFLSALGALAAHETVQSRILESDVEHIQRIPEVASESPVNCAEFLCKLLDNLTSVSANSEENQEAMTAIFVIYQLLVNDSLKSNPKLHDCVEKIKQVSKSSAVRTNSTVSRVFQYMIWRFSQPKISLNFTTYHLLGPKNCGPIIMSYAPINRPAVEYFMDQLQAAGLPVWNDNNPTFVFGDNTQTVGLSALAASTKSMESWLECLQHATAMVVCLSDAYRLTPGCRVEVEQFLSTNSPNSPKMLIHIIMPPKFTPGGWVKNLPGFEEFLDFTHKNTFISMLRRLIAKLGKIYGISVDEDSVNSAEGRKGYISVEDLNALKSSSIFLTSSISSSLEMTSNISHTADKMMSKGSLRRPKQTDLELGSIVTPNSTTPRSSRAGALSLYARGAEPREYTFSVPNTNEPMHPVEPHSGKGEQISPDSLFVDVDRPATSDVQPEYANTLSNRTPKVTNRETSEVDVFRDAEKDYRPIDEKDIPPPTVQLPNKSASQEISQKTKSVQTSFQNAGGKERNKQARPLATDSEEQSNLTEGQVKSPVNSPAYKGLRELPKTATGQATVEDLKGHERVETEPAAGQLLPVASSTQYANLKSGKSGQFEDFSQMNAVTPVQAKRSPVALSAHSEPIPLPVQLHHLPTSSHENIRSERMEKVKREIQSTDKQASTLRTESGANGRLENESIKKLASPASSQVLTSSIGERSNIRRESSHSTTPWYSSVTVGATLDEVRTIPTPGLGLNALSSGAMSSIVLGNKPYRDVAHPSIRRWDVEQVNNWFKSKKLDHLIARISDRMNGVILAQLINLRFWAPEYFAQCLRSELELDFVDSLMLVAALEELSIRTTSGMD
ncbi:unnamed protein product [Calicophoron daubneyi]|uniref:TIR domain-containing protein n=1 Tax=Calicophoron daubneyi TaxID=300641 RepID=A0AAV2TTF6_CALDB